MKGVARINQDHISLLEVSQTNRAGAFGLARLVFDQLKLLYVKRSFTGQFVTPVFYLKLSLDFLELKPLHDVRELSHVLNYLVVVLLDHIHKSF